jgi:Zn-dependent peptidase ImmA (M78 family)/transcriptional regulator with XRE-family HTH domain
MEIFNRDMLQLARGARGLTQSELASASDVTQALISRIENGLDAPSEEVLSSLSKALHFPRAFFFEEDRALGLPQYHYRKRAKLGARILQKIEADTNIRRIHVQKLSRSFELGHRVNTPIIDLDLAELTPQQAAQQLRGYWTIPRGPIDNLTAIVERAGIVIIPVNFGTHLMDALSFRIPGVQPLIFINCNLPGDRYRFTLAHEVAHLILHNSPMSDDKMEEEADKFAAEFLMPAIEIRPYLKSPSLGTLGRVKGLWKVSIKSLIVNSYHLKLITPSQYRGLNVNYSKAGYSKGEPFPIELERPSLLPEMVAYHIQNLSYSAQEIARLLLLEVDEFQDIYLEKKRLRLVVNN